jgi:phage shock protein A
MSQVCRSPEAGRRTLPTDAHGAVDVPGDQTTLLKVHVRDAEEAVQRKRVGYAQLAAESTRLSSERTRARADCERFERDVKLALNGERRDLARYALRLLLRRQRVIDTVDRRLAQVTREQKELEIVLARQQAALEELRGRVQAYLSDWEADHFAATAEPVTDEQVELELLRRLKQLDAPDRTSQTAPRASDGGADQAPEPQPQPEEKRESA